MANVNQPITTDDAALQQVREDRFLIDAYDAWLLEEISPYLGERILEIGCGLGNLIRYLKDKEFVLGIDTSLESIVNLRSQYKGFPNLAFEHADITESKILQYEKYNLDTVVSLNTLEHISNDELALMHAFRLLMPRGNLILIVPAHQWLYGTMDASIGHYRRYSKKDLQSKLNSLGFKVKMQKYINVAGAVGWFINGRIIRQRVPPQNQLKIMNLVVPPLKRMEQLINMPFGISIITIAER